MITAGLRYTEPGIPKVPVIIKSREKIELTTKGCGYIIILVLALRQMEC